MSVRANCSVMLRKTEAMIIGLESDQIHHTPDLHKGYSSDDLQRDSLIMVIEFILFYLDLTLMGTD